MAKASKSRLTIIENSCNPLSYIEYVFAVQGWHGTATVLGSQANLKQQWLNYCPSWKGIITEFKLSFPAQHRFRITTGNLIDPVPTKTKLSPSKCSYLARHLHEGEGLASDGCLAKATKCHLLFKHLKTITSTCNNNMTRYHPGIMLIQSGYHPDMRWILWWLLWLDSNDWNLLWYWFTCCLLTAWNCFDLCHNAAEGEHCQASVLQLLTASGGIKLKPTVNS